MKLQMRKYPIADFNKPRSGSFQVYCDYWWPVSTDHKIFFFGTERSPYQSPQCNLNRDVVDRITSGSSLITEPFTLAQLPIISIPINWSDYHD